MTRWRNSVLFVVVLTCAAVSPARADTPGKGQLPQRVIVSNSASWVPYSFLDETGNPRGVLIDLWRLFAAKNNIEVEFRLVDWAESIELVRSGAADVHGGLIASEARTKILHFFPREVLRIRSLVFFEEDLGVRDLAALTNLSLGVVAGSTEEDYLRKNFPDLPLKLFPNSEVLVKSAVAGEIPAFISDYPTGYYHLIRQHSLDLFVTGPTLFTRPIQVATRLGDTEELQRIAASVVEIPRAEVMRALDKWLIPEDPTPPWLVPSIAAAVLALVLVAFGAHTVVLRQTLRVKTEQLRSTVEDLQAANLELDRLARLDALTEVPNRYSFFEAAPRELERAKRYGRALSLVMFDLDHFKLINDRHGHQAGDAALRYVAELTQTHLRPSDVFARIGGEEFAILIPETNSQQAALLAQRILDSAIAAPLQYEAKSIPVSFSAGIAQYAWGESLDSLIARADGALYQSKAFGRSRVSVATAGERAEGDV